MELLAKLLTAILIGLGLLLGGEAIDHFAVKRATKFLQDEVAKEIKRPWGDPNPFQHWEYDWEKIPPKH